MAIDYDPFADVNAALKQDELTQFFKSNLPFIITFIVVLIVGTGGMSVYHNWQNKVALEQSAELIRLNNLPVTIANADSLRDYASRTATGTRKMLGYLLAAAKYNDAGKTDEANKIYAHIATLSSGDRELDAYAKLAAFQHGADATLPEFNKNSPWHLAQLELAALNAKNSADMKKIYAQIAAAPDVPPAMKERAAQFAGTVSELDQAVK